MNTDSYIRSPGSVLFYGVLLSSTALFFGFSVGIFNPFAGPFLRYTQNIHDEKEIEAIQSKINFFMVVGGTLACFVSSFLIEKLGRYRFLLLVSLGQILVGFGYMIPSLTLLYIFRVAAGFLSTASTFICPLMINEVVPEKYNGPVGGSFYVFLTGGILFAALFASDAIAPYWKLILAIPSFLEIPKFLLYLFVYRIESPKSIVARSSSPESDIHENYLRIYTSEGSRYYTDRFMNDYNSNSAGKTVVTFGSLFTPDFRLAFLIGLLLNFLNQATGINMLVMYSTKIFRDRGYDQETAAYITFVLSLLNFGGAIYITLFGKLHRKRSLLVFGLATQTLAYFVLLIGLVFDVRILVVAGCCVFMGSFSISLGGTLYPYLAETVPAVGISFAAITQWFLACLVALYAPKFYDFMGPFNTFYIFMVSAFLGCIIFAGYSVETEGKTEAQIQGEFRKKEFMY
jgi:hypothetical protein